MKIGILQTGHCPDQLRDEMGTYGEMFIDLLAGHEFTFEIFSVLDGEFPENAKVADGWLITGSKHGVYEDHPWIAPLEDLIRDIKLQNLPMIGICFGHQIIAQALGGTVEKFDGGWSVGPVEYPLEGEKYTIMAWHQDQVITPPKGAKLVGSTDFCRYAALEYDNQIWTLQPHPEFTNAFVKALIETRGKGVVPDAQLAQASAKLTTSISRERMAQKMATWFLDRNPNRRKAS